VSRVLAALAGADRDAVVLRDARRALGAAEALARIDDLAAALDDLPPGPVGSRLDNGIDAVLLDLALRRCARAHVALPPFFTDAQAAAALAPAVAVALPAAYAQGPALHGAGLGLQVLPRAPLPVPRGTALVTCTSGSTGTPKGVCLDAALPEAVAASLVEAMLPLGVRRHLCVLPLGVLLETIGGVYAPLLAGGEVVVPALGELGHGGSGALDVARLVACLQQVQPDSLILVPQLLHALVAAAESGAALPRSLRMLAVGGARVPRRLLARAAALGLPVFQGYGLSECASVVCLERPGAQRAGSVGRVLPHTGLRVDADGELLVTGPRFLGYAGCEPAPPGPYATGDLGRIDDGGFVHIEGRRKAMYITAWGRNVSPEWVESELTQHPRIAQALAWGEGRASAVALLVPRSPDVSLPALEQAVAEVNAGLPDYARVGAVLRADETFSVDNGLLTGNGRPRREVLLARYGARLAALPDPHRIPSTEALSA
jgi:acyl-CoA synthetase (AMP-forming)/AMP-acid ligase II